MVTLINRSGRCLVFNLPHQHVCRDACLCTPPSAPRGRAVCGSITLPAGQAVTGLPAAVLRAPELLAAARRGDVEVQTKEPKKATAEPPRSPRSGARDKRARRKRGGSR